VSAREVQYMAKPKKPMARARGSASGRKTTVTFTEEDLNVLSKVLAAGQVMLPTSHRALWRLRTAMTRIGVVVPKGV